MSERSDRAEGKKREAFLFGPVPGECVTDLSRKTREWPPPTGKGQSALAVGLAERTEKRAVRTGTRARCRSDRTKQPCRSEGTRAMVVLNWE